MQKERAKIIELKKYMVSKGLLENDELEKQSEDEKSEAIEQ